MVHLKLGMGSPKNSEVSSVESFIQTILMVTSFWWNFILFSLAIPQTPFRVKY